MNFHIHKQIMYYHLIINTHNVIKNVYIRQTFIDKICDSSNLEDVYNTRTTIRK